MPFPALSALSAFYTHSRIGKRTSLTSITRLFPARPPRLRASAVRLVFAADRYNQPMPTTDTVCPKCSGTGFIIVEGAHVTSAKRCDCGSQGRAGRMEERSQIPLLYRNASFENFVVPGPDNPIA